MSINRITYFHDFLDHAICILNDPDINIFDFSDSLDVKHFLEELKEDQIYVVTFEFVYSFSTYNEEGPTINLSKPILITKNSNCRIISKFIQDRINDCINTYNLNESLIYSNNKDGSGVIVKYREVNLF
ncbi:MAG: hypothetical protein E6L00_04750 [Thaumarchaeota archaeon]|jgi:hypothetical protein|nr:MAG: hypothetical protein E6L00_04750 [Nitrososphaerota archaeon]